MGYFGILVSGLAHDVEPGTPFGPSAPAGIRKPFSAGPGSLSAQIPTGVKCVHLIENVNLSRQLISF